MPKRVIDFDAMWGSDKIGSCAEWAQAEYAWLYGLADASGCFEVTNLRVIWGRVAAIRRSLTIERLEQIFGEFQDKGLLFVWEQDGKRYGHWTGSDVPGRLPAPSWRMRLERLAPPMPKQLLAEYVSRFARGRAASPGGGFLADARRREEHLKFEISNLRQGERSGAGRASGGGDGQEGVGVQDDLRFELSNLIEGSQRGAVKAEGWRGGGGAVRAESGRAGWNGLKGGVEAGQAQDLDLELDLNWEGNENGGGVRVRGAAERNAERGAGNSENLFSEMNCKATANADANAKAKPNSSFNSNANSNLNSNSSSNSNANSNANSNINSNTKTNVNDNSNPNSNAKALLGSRANANLEFLGEEDRESDGNGNGNAGSNAGTNLKSTATALLDSRRNARLGSCDRDDGLASDSAAGQGNVDARGRPNFGAEANGNAGSGGNLDSRGDGGRGKTENGVAGAVAPGQVPGAAVWGERKVERGAAAYAGATVAFRDKAEQVARELRVGQGPSSCGPVRVKPEALERIRLREMRREVSRSP